MSRLLIDSNTITYILQERPPVLSQLTEAVQANSTFFSADVVDYEIRRYLLLKGASRQLQRYEDLIRDWEPVSLSRDEWNVAARLWAEYHRKGVGVEDRDLLIAVSAMRVEATLVTSNTRHFENIDIALQDWLDPGQPSQNS